MGEYLYSDHLFGDLDQPAKGSIHHIEQTRGVHHAYRIFPWHPEPDEPFRLMASTSSDLAVQGVVLRYSLDQGANWKEAHFEAAHWRWDTLIWGWLRDWTLDFPAVQDDGELLYQVMAELPGGRRLYADSQSADSAGATLFRLWLTRTNRPPRWSETALVYQIFVDRFSPGEGKSWLQTSDLLLPFGGSLRGVTEKLDYIRDLGFNTLWLTPIFATASHHGYDITDYFTIEPRLGTEADLRELFDRAHAKGMRVLLDFVANHCSSLHQRFQSALAGKKADLPWFQWKTWPEYRSFYEVAGMPCLNLEPGSPAREHLIEAARHWLRFGADGFRLDYANGPAREFWVEFQRACLEVNPECWTFGEIVAPADEQFSFAGSMHGVLDFQTCQALRETFASGGWSLSRLAGYLESYWAAYPRAFSKPAFIDNHDMNRFFFSASGSAASQAAALRLLFLLPGPPIVYYGSERELSQVKSIHAGGALGFDEARMAMNWHEKDDCLSAKVIREMTSYRRQHPWLCGARWRALELEESRVVFEVSNASNRLLVEVAHQKGSWFVSVE